MGIVLMISIGLHEYAHARSSYKLGDPTPRLQGRLTLNPLKHLSLLWFFAIFFIWFWWGKPVQVNPSYYKNPFRDELITALAGPLMNFFLAIFGCLMLFSYSKLSGITWAQMINHDFFDLVNLFWFYFIRINIALGVFNLIPLYPLDGYRLVGIFSKDAYNRMRRNATLITIWFLLLMILPISIIPNFIGWITNKILDTFFMIFNLIFY